MKSSKFPLHLVGYHFVLWNKNYLPLEQLCPAPVGVLEQRTPGGSAMAGKWVDIIIFPHLFMKSLSWPKKYFYSPSTVLICSSTYWLHMQEQVLQVFSFNTRRSTERPRNGEGVGMLLCAPCVSSYLTRHASPATLHGINPRIKPAPCRVTDQEDPALNLPPKPCSQTRSTGPWCVGITDPKPQTPRGGWLQLRECEHQLCLPRD